MWMRPQRHKIGGKLCQFSIFSLGIDLFLFALSQNVLKTGANNLKVCLSGQITCFRITLENYNRFQTKKKHISAELLSRVSQSVDTFCIVPLYHSSRCLYSTQCAIFAVKSCFLAFTWYFPLISSSQRARRNMETMAMAE